MFKGLIIPSHILLSDKNPRENVTKTHEGALLPRVFWSHFREGFRQTATYEWGWLIPIMTYPFTIIFSVINREAFWFYQQDVLIFGHFPQNVFGCYFIIPPQISNYLRQHSSDVTTRSIKTSFSHTDKNIDGCHSYFIPGPIWYRSNLINHGNTHFILKYSFMTWNKSPTSSDIM